MHLCYTVYGVYFSYQQEQCFSAGVKKKHREPRDQTTRERECLHIIQGCESSLVPGSPSGLATA